jgi:hypothetical protein
VSGDSGQSDLQADGSTEPIADDSGESGAPQAASMTGDGSKFPWLLIIPLICLALAVGGVITYLGYMRWVRSRDQAGYYPNLRY